MLGGKLPVASDMQMIRELLRRTGRQPAVPVAALALGGIVGAIALSRSGAVREAGRDTLRALPDDVREAVRDGAGAMGISEKTVAVFAATFIAKAVSSSFRRRGEEKARALVEALIEALGERRQG